ncbi:MAG TPA: CGNR zinc finger domain-containing protein [Chryseosolibacter sp.]|nr:CGNR zinc finger domain-containing protein [Chryseosolibacter sp.]
MVKNSRIATISLDGETLCLNFTNTVHNRTENPPPDYLLNMVDLIAWAEKVVLLDERHARRLDKLATENPKKARQFFSEAIAMRELLYRIFFPIAAHKKIAPDDLAQFNTLLKSSFSHMALVSESGTYKADWDFPSDSFQQITAPIVKDAYDLLLSGKLDRVKECPNCGWLFLDTTRNGKRRWCSMKNCGSNIKALEWYHRHKGES